MVKVRPFKAIRPEASLADKVASLPYDVLNTQEARELGKDNPYSFLHVDKAEIDLSETISPYDPEVYKQAQINLTTFLNKSWLQKDNEAHFYIYQLIMNGRAQTGIVACTSIDDYINKKIKKHEFTRAEKELDRIRHVDACDANTSPIFLTYRHQAAIDQVIAKWLAEKEVIYDFESFHDVRHRIWIIDEKSAIKTIEEAFDEVPALYIADGHHRTESAVKVGLKRREAYPERGEDAEFNTFLAVLFPEQELSIWDYNRVINIPIESDFLEKLQTAFEISESPDRYKPEAPKYMGMYLNGKWYKLKVKDAYIPTDEVEKLDVSILQTQVLTPLFGITDIRRDERIDFVGGIRGLGELENLVDSGKQTIAFAMYPTTIEDLLHVADANKIMPPKSTWFEPKLLSGLFVHDLETK